MKGPQTIVLFLVSILGLIGCSTSSPTPPIATAELALLSTTTQPPALTETPTSTPSETPTSTPSETPTSTPSPEPSNTPAPTLTPTIGPLSAELLEYLGSRQITSYRKLDDGTIVAFSGDDPVLVDWSDGDDWQAVGRYVDRATTGINGIAEWNGEGWSSEVVAPEGAPGTLYLDDNGVPVVILEDGTVVGHYLGNGNWHAIDPHLLLQGKILQWNGAGWVEMAGATEYEGIFAQPEYRVDEDGSLHALGQPFGENGQRVDMVWNVEEGLWRLSAGQEIVVAVGLSEYSGNQSKQKLRDEYRNSGVRGFTYLSTEGAKLMGFRVVVLEDGTFSFEQAVLWKNQDEELVVVKLRPDIFTGTSLLTLPNVSVGVKENPTASDVFSDDDGTFWNHTGDSSVIGGLKPTSGDDPLLKLVADVYWQLQDEARLVQTSVSLDALSGGGVGVEACDSVSGDPILGFHCKSAIQRHVDAVGSNPDHSGVTDFPDLVRRFNTALSSQMRLSDMGPDWVSGFWQNDVPYFGVDGVSVCVSVYVR